MSVLCVQIPDFLPALAVRHDPSLRQRPFALLANDETICAVSGGAAQWGVRPDMRPRLARSYCPELLVRSLASLNCDEQQAAFLSELTSWELPVETLDWGAAYIDLHTIETKAERVKPLASDLGKRLRQRLGEALQPAIGWDSGKFTARAAAVHTAAGRLRLVDKADESHFLSPLPVNLLPLPLSALQRLHWLGIGTLGQYTRLPQAGLLQQFGKMGLLAQQWAAGKDSRPVHSNIAAPAEAITIDLDPPTEQLPPVLTAISERLRPTCDSMAARLQGTRRLGVALRFVEGSSLSHELPFVESINQVERLENAISAHLYKVNWQGELSQVQLTLLEITEMRMQQLSLFDETQPTANRSALSQLSGRYGAIFFRSQVADPLHPAPERRFSFTNALPAP